MMRIALVALCAVVVRADAGNSRGNNGGSSGDGDGDKVGIKVVKSTVVGMTDIVITAEDVEFKALDTTMKTIVESKDNLRSNLFSILEDTKTELMEHSADADKTFGEALVQSADALEAKITDGDDKLAVAVAGFQGDVEEWMASVQSEMNAFDQSIQKRLAELDQAISKSLDNGLASAENEIASASAKAISAVTAAGGVGDVKIKELDATLAKYATDDAIIWAGGTKQNPSFRGKRDLKMDRTDLDLSGDYFTHSTAFFTIKKAGVYRLNWWTNMEGRGCHAHARVRINNKCATGNNYNSFSPYYGNYWRDMHVDFTWVYKVGEKVNMQINSCGKGWNNDAKSNFMTFQYLGQTTSKPRANTVSC